MAVTSSVAECCDRLQNSKTFMLKTKHGHTQDHLSDRGFERRFKRLRAAIESTRCASCIAFSRFENRVINMLENLLSWL